MTVSMAMWDSRATGRSSELCLETIVSQKTKAPPDSGGAFLMPNLIKDRTLIPKQSPRYTLQHLTQFVARGSAVKLNETSL
jgi:hypothetical protein